MLLVSLKLDVECTGIKVTSFIELVETSQATHIMQYYHRGYISNSPPEDFMGENNFLAFELFGEFLPPDHGRPMRYVYSED